MINGWDGGRPPPGGGGGDEPDDPMAEALSEADDQSLLSLGVALLAELKDRGLLRIVLRNRTDAVRLFEVESVQFEDGALEVTAEGFHAETPDHYGVWVREADALHEGLTRPGLTESDAEELLEAASDEALLLELERAREIGEAPAADGGAREEGGDGIGDRIAIELLRRGVIEATDVQH